MTTGTSERADRPRTARWLRAAAFVFGPVWAVAFVLTLASLERDIVIVPFYVSAAEGADAYPVVSHLPAWTRAAPQRAPALSPGDQVLEIEGRSLRGAGALRVVSVAWSAMDSDGSLTVVARRGDARIEAHVAIPATIPKWPVLIVSAVFAAFALVGALRFANVPVAAYAFPSLMATALWLAANFGHTPSERLAAFWLRAVALAAVLPTAAFYFRHFPEGRDDAVRWARGWPWLLAIQGVFFVDAEMFGRLPPWLGDLGPKLLTPVAVGLFLALGTVNYRHASRAGRRRFKWLLIGAWVGLLPPVTVATLSAIRPELGAWFLPSQLALLALPFSVSLGLGRADGFDVDRLWNATFVYLGAGALVIVGAVRGLPGFTSWLVPRFELEPATAQILGLALLLAFAAPIAVACHRKLDAWVLAERKAREAAAARLQGRIATAEKLEEVAVLLVEQLPAIFGSTRAAFYVDLVESFAPVAIESEAGPVPPPGPATESRIVRVLERADHPVAASEVARDPVGGEGGPPDALLDFADLLAPVRVMEGAGGRRLAAFVALGPPHDGGAHDGATRPLLAAIAASAGATLTALESGTMLGEARRLHRDLVERNAATERRSREKTSLLAAASHDLRQPLHALGLFLGALEDRIVDAPARKLLADARASARSMEQMFTALLDVSQLDAGVIEPRVADDVALAPILADLEREFAPLARTQGLSLRARPSDDTVRSDPALLRSILQNLVGNALRYTERGGVLIGVRRRGGNVRIEVWDTGPGFTPERRAQLFAEWQRGETAEGSRGHGLGLTIVKRLADLLGHALEIASVPGRGSVFALTVAPGRSLPRIASPSSDAGAPRTLTGRRLLVVDDEPDARASLTALLEGWGAEVRAARDAGEALAWLEAERIDAWIVDLDLAGESGAELLASRPEIPGCLVSGAGPERLAEARRAGHFVLAKPVEPVRLRAALEHLLAAP